MLRRYHSLVVLLPLLLAGCSAVPPAPAIDTRALEAEARAAVGRGDLVTARERYATLVGAVSGSERQRLQVQLASVELELGDPEAALTTLDAVLPPLPDELALLASSLRAEALFAVGDTVSAVRLLVERDLLLDSAEAILANQALIWDGLRQAPGRTGAFPPTGDAVVDGWLALAPLTALPSDSSEFLVGLTEWRTSFAGHPAVTGILAEQLLAVRDTTTRPSRVALLLPVGARSIFSAQARAVRDGVMTAHFTSSEPEATAIAMYDTSIRGSAESYREALRDGADFIIGPLVSDEIPQVLAQAGFVPTLALNVGAGETAGVPQFYQFALSSDDEVEAIAARAIAAGHRTAAILHASSNFGYNVSDNFRAAFEARGGRIIGSRVYAGDAASLAAPIEELLNVAQSEARFNRLDQIVSRPIEEFQPLRRADIDMIFLQIDQPATARLLVPMLEAYTANAIPTYSTRDVYDPTNPVTGDLDGLIFADLPLLLQPVGEAQTAAQALAEFSSEYAERFPREFAFGFDAYRIAEALAAPGAASWPLAGATGELHLGANGRIRRVLPIAEIRGGRPRVLLIGPELISSR